jgi:hypothetical protein
MHVGGALVNWVTRAELPSSAGHGVAPVNVAPGAIGGGVTPPLGSEVEVEAVVVDGELDVRRDPMTAPTVERTTTAATTPATI